MEAPELDARLDRKFSNLRDFQRNQKELWATIGSGYFVCQVLIKSIVVLPDLTAEETHRLMMWETVLDYDMESFFLLIDSRLDEGGALLRMASELSRDIARIGNNPGRLEAWLNRSKGAKKRNQYRDSFRFDDSNAFERYIHKLYDLSSQFGVHGHTTRTAALRSMGTLEDGRYVVLQVPDDEVFKTLRLWLAAFYPLHQVCVQSFFPRRREELAVPYKTFGEMWEAFDGVFKLYCENLIDIDADEMSSLDSTS